MNKKSLLKYIYFPFLHVRAEMLARQIQDHLPQKSSLLDIGCGNMLVSQKLKERLKLRVMGIDVLDMNLTDLPHQIFGGERIPFPSGYFDASMLIGVLHHIEKQEAILVEARRVSRKKILIFEDVYFSEFGKQWVKIRDIMGNLPEEAKMNFALKFNDTSKWEQIFGKNRLKVTHKKVYFNIFRFTHHVLYVLEKA